MISCAMSRAVLPNPSAARARSALRGRRTTRRTTRCVSPGRALPLEAIADVAVSDQVLAYGSIGFFGATIAFFAYRAFGSAFIGPQASASHVLVKSRARADALKREIEEAVAGGAPLRATFARVAEKESTCPSSKKGGELGSFRRGQMVREFDDVVFTGDLNTVLGPVDTQFGSHLILITDRDADAK